jgi:hypothetical protein
LDLQSLEHLTPGEINKNTQRSGAFLQLLLSLKVLILIPIDQVILDQQENIKQKKYQKKMRII